MLSREQIDFLLRAAYNASIRAGAKISEIYRQYDDFFVSLKADNTPLTIADSEAHTIIKNYLSSTRIPLLSEEGRDMFYEERCGWDLFWLVDPLDGTDEFIKRNGEFTVNIALMQDGIPLLGVIYVPNSSTVYFSDPDRGAFCKTNVDGDVSSDVDVSGIFSGALRLPLHEPRDGVVRVAMSRSHESSTACRIVEGINDRLGRVELLEYGSSLKFCLVADGTADIYIRTTPTMEWDTAAGEAIARGAGINTLSLDGTSLRYNKDDLGNPPFVCCRHDWRANPVWDD